MPSWIATGAFLCPRNTRKRKDPHVSCPGRPVLGEPDRRHAARAQRRCQLGGYHGSPLLHCQVVVRSPAGCSEFHPSSGADTRECWFGAAADRESDEYASL